MVLTRGEEPARPGRRPRHRRRRPGRRRTPTRPGSTRARPTPRTPRTRCSCGSTSTTARDGRSRPASCSAACRRPGRPDPGMATWATTKEQAATLLGLRLERQGRARHPDAGRRRLRQLPPRAAARPAAVRHGLRARRGRHHRARSPVPANALHFDTPFLTDIAHNAEPLPLLVPDADNTASADFASQPAGTYDDEMLDAHFIAGDGRVNENIGLTAIHQVFHSEHDRLVDDIENVLTNDTCRDRRRRARPVEARAVGRQRLDTASGCSRRPGSSPRWSTSTWCSRSSPARSSRRSTRSSRSPSPRPTSTRRSGPSSPTRSTASATRC